MLPILNPPPPKYQAKKLVSPQLLALLGLSWLMVACASTAQSPLPSPTPSLAQELTFYNWTDDKIEAVFPDFTQEYGVKINCLIYESQEEVIENMQSGHSYDLVAMDSQFVPKLVSDKLLTEIDYRYIPNFKNISANFRDLVYDPANNTQSLIPGVQAAWWCA